MSKQSDADDLANRLDQVVGSGTLPTTDPDPLVDAALRLANAPQPSLTPAQIVQMQARIANMTRPGRAAPASRLRWIVGTAAVGAVVVGAVLLWQNRSQPPELTALAVNVTQAVVTEEPLSPTPVTASPTLTVVPSATAAPTSTEAPPSPTPAASATLSPVPSDTAAPEPTGTPFMIAIIESPRPVNVRKGPGLDYAVVTVLQPGTRLPVLGWNGDAQWLHVVLNDGRDGWIASSLMRTGDFADVTPTINPAANTLPNSTPGTNSGGDTSNPNNGNNGQGGNNQGGNGQGGNFGCDHPGNYCNAPGQQNTPPGNGNHGGGKP